MRMQRALVQFAVDMVRVEEDSVTPSRAHLHQPGRRAARRKVHALAARRARLLVLGPVPGLVPLRRPREDELAALLHVVEEDEHRGWLRAEGRLGVYVRLLRGVSAQAPNMEAHLVGGRAISRRQPGQAVHPVGDRRQLLGLVLAHEGLRFAVASLPAVLQQHVALGGRQEASLHEDPRVGVGQRSHEAVAVLLGSQRWHRRHTVEARVPTRTVREVDAAVRLIAKPSLGDPLLPLRHGTRNVEGILVLFAISVVVVEQHGAPQLWPDADHRWRILLGRLAAQLGSVDLLARVRVHVPLRAAVPPHGEERVATLLWLVEVREHGVRPCHLVARVRVQVPLVLRRGVVPADLQALGHLVGVPSHAVHALQDVPEQGHLLLLLRREPDLLVVARDRLLVVPVRAALHHHGRLHPQPSVGAQELALLRRQEVIYQPNPRLQRDQADVLLQCARWRRKLFLALVRVGKDRRVLLEGRPGPLRADVSQLGQGLLFAEQRDGRLRSEAPCAALEQEREEKQQAAL
mmetsp:Transcript_50887/g.131182  ORF Transcript_50887/g.131182 Transcript_50887/m.131182 type:complete len:519 (+) Transcript_50887:447-2003(+)